MSSTSLDLSQSIVRILSPGGATVGTGFIVYRDGLIATCAHVVQACGAGPGDTVRLAFHATEEERGATVERDWWRDPGAEDVAILRLQGPLPDGVEPLPLGSSLHSRGHDFFSWGYRLAYVFPGGLAAEGKIQARTLYRNQPALQLLSNQIDRGMSGAPLWDVQGRRVVGMINTFWETTRHQDAWLALAIPTETLRAVCPLLQLSDLCPYRGLEPFNEADAEFFFGRERAVEHLLERLRQEPRFLAVLGPSGSGKSSLVRAGLIPRLRRGAVPRSDRWAFIVIRPGRDPFSELEAEGLSDASQGLVEAVRNWQRLHPEAERLALALDQLEELLVDCLEETRREFVAQLAALLDSPLPVTIILVMRDDFYSRFVREARPLVKWLERSLANVPLTLEPDELRAIVEKPARAVGLTLEEGLAEVIVRETLETTPQGAPSTILPLLEFALTGLWERREEGLLTHAAYQAIGGVTGGLTQWADGVLSQLDEEQSRLARRVLTDLVHLGDESRNIPDSRRRRTLDELCRHEGEQEAVHQLVRLLADARLLITGRDLATGRETVELIHDALLREWGQLQSWLQEDRRFLAWRQTLEERLREWQDKGKDEGLLLRGAALAEAQGWLARRAMEIKGKAQEFIRLSVERAEAEQRRIILGLATGLVIALLLAGLAFWQAAEARRQRNLAQARQMAATGQVVFDRTAHGPIIGTILGVEALRRGGPYLEADQLVRRGLEFFPAERTRMTHDGAVTDIALNSDGRYVVSGSEDGTVRIWEIQTGREIARMIHEDGVTAVDFSPDARYVVSGGWDGTARVWEVQTGREIARMPHEGSVYAVAFSLDGRYVVSGGEDGTARVWEAQTGHEIACMTHEDEVTAVDFSSDARYVVSGGWDGTARVWEAQTGREVARMPHEGGVHVVTFSLDGRYVVSGDEGGTARVWEAQTGREIARMTSISPWPILAVAFSLDGKYVVSGSMNGTVRVWETKSGREIARMTHEGSVYAVAFSPDGHYVISGGKDKTVRVWEVQTGREIARMTHEDNVNDVTFSPDGRYIVSGSDDSTVRVWKITIRREVARMTQEGDVYAVAFSPDGHYAVSGGLDKTVRVWEVEIGREVTRMIHEGSVYAVAFSPDGQYVLSGSRDKTARVWEAQTGHEVTHMNHEGSVYAIAFSPDGHFVVSRSADGTARVWEAKTGREVSRITHDGKVYEVAFSPDGCYVVSGGKDKTVRVWEAASGREVARITHEYPVLAVAFSPDGRYIISGDFNGAVRVWEATSGREVARMTHGDSVDAVAFSPDGKYVVSVSRNGTMRIWEAMNGREIARMSHEDIVHAVAFSPDGHYVLSGSRDKTVRVWEVQTGREIARMTHEDDVNDVTFSPDGRYIISGSSDSTVRVWLWRPEDLIAEACRRLPRNLTRAEWQQYIGPDIPYRPTCPNLPVPEE